jgi:hypothetical protein
MRKQHQAKPERASIQIDPARLSWEHSSNIEFATWINVGPAPTPKARKTTKLMAGFFGIRNMTNDLIVSTRQRASPNFDGHRFRFADHII